MWCYFKKCGWTYSLEHFFFTQCNISGEFIHFSISVFSLSILSITSVTVQFADDQVIIAGDKEDLQYMTRKLKETYEYWGLEMNLEKT